MRFLCLSIVTRIFPLLYQFFDIINFLLFYQWFFQFRVFYVNLCILILFCFSCVLSFFRNIMEHGSLPTHQFNLIPFHYIYIYLIKIRLWIIIKNNPFFSPKSTNNTTTLAWLHCHEKGGGYRAVWDTVHVTPWGAGSGKYIVQFQCLKGNFEIRSYHIIFIFIFICCTRGFHNLDIYAS